MRVYFDFMQRVKISRIEMWARQSPESASLTGSSKGYEQISVLIGDREEGVLTQFGRVQSGSSAATTVSSFLQVRGAVQAGPKAKAPASLVWEDVVTVRGDRVVLQFGDGRGPAAIAEVAIDIGFADASFGPVPEIEEEVTVFASVPGALSCDESGTGVDYLGCQTRTKTGIECQPWGAQSPHTHSYTNKIDEDAKKNGYCR